MTSFPDRVRALGVSGERLLALHRVDAHRGGQGHAMICCPNSGHEDRNPSCSVNLDTGRARCFGCGWNARDVVALHCEIQGLPSMGEALRDLEARSGCSIPPLTFSPSFPAKSRDGGTRPKGRPTTVATWDYSESDETPAFTVLRRQFRLPDGIWWSKPGSSKPHKDFVQTHPGGHPRQLPDRFKNGRLRPLYLLPELVRAHAESLILVVEGESAADALRTEEILATTSSGGANNAHLTDWSPLAGRNVLIWPDNDEPGKRFAADVTGLLAALSPPPTVAEVNVETLHLPLGGDAVDRLSKHTAPFVALVAYVAGSGGIG